MILAQIHTENGDPFPAYTPSCALSEHAPSHISGDKSAGGIIDLRCRQTETDRDTKTNMRIAPDEII